ncbi:MULTISPECIES: hypothetical protein [Photorhabdus]|uniref:Lipoprotein n=1 Tax=Photorhabdus thracensis TaxID=230089 RepID=A0A0F7LS14_9GAMM|nr:hypothetical protein [Photorhabdus thracensis]AKH64641.1 hypothetical protein VY86_16160 [Photorhabdus thracensis]MCC8420055.1 hypothetical protein [Photorhabdus thracensis]
MHLNKKIFLISPFLLAMSSFSMACMKDPEVIRNQVKDAIIKNELEKTKVMSMYENCKLRANVKDFEKRNDIELNKVKDSQDPEDSNMENAKYWYRGMDQYEYRSLDDKKKNNYERVVCVTEEKSYCGITPQFTYAKIYPKPSPGKSKDRIKPKITIRFNTEEHGWLYNDFNGKHGCEGKTEAGESSYGLGKQGTSKSCDEEYKRLGIGNVFNKWLSEGKIQAEVYYVLLPKDPKK